VLNDCHFTDPSQARCLKNASTAARDAPLIAACQPARCANASIHHDHLPAWRGVIAHARLTVSNLAAEAGLSRQQAYRSQVIHTFRDATRELPSTDHPDKTQARMERLARDLAASQQRAKCYRQERDESHDRAKTLANACRALDEENQALRTALADARVVSPLRHRAGDDHHGLNAGR